jgi:hypothetical protein
VPGFVPPIASVGDESSDPKFKPMSVTDDGLPLVGPLVLYICVSNGGSYVNRLEPVPVFAETVTCTNDVGNHRRSSPAGCAHVSDVSDVYDVEAQIVAPSRAVVVVSRLPKLNPLIVTLPPPVFGALNAVTYVSAGVS